MGLCLQSLYKYKCTWNYSPPLLSYSSVAAIVSVQLYEIKTDVVNFHANINHNLFRRFFIEYFYNRKITFKYNVKTISGNITITRSITKPYPKRHIYKAGLNGF